MTQPPDEAPAPRDLVDSEVTPRALSQILDYQVAWQYQAIPVKLQDGRLTVGMVSPGDSEALAGLKAASGYELDVFPLEEATFEQMYAASYPDSVFVDGSRRVRANPRLLRAVQEAGGLLSTSSEFLGYGLLIVFGLAGIAIFYYFAQTLIFMVLHVILHPAFLVAAALLVFAGFVFLRVAGDRRR